MLKGDTYSFDVVPQGDKAGQYQKTTVTGTVNSAEDTEPLFTPAEKEPASDPDRQERDKALKEVYEKTGDYLAGLDVYKRQLIIRGVNVFPSQVETVIAKFDKELTMNYKLYVGREHNTDTFELAVELAEGLAIDDIGFVEALRGRVEHALRDILGIGCKVRLLNEGTLPRSEGKAVRVEDTRQL